MAYVIYDEHQRIAKIRKNLTAEELSIARLRGYETKFVTPPEEAYFRSVIENHKRINRPLGKVVLK